MGVPSNFSEILHRKAFSPLLQLQQGGFGVLHKAFVYEDTPLFSFAADDLPLVHQEVYILLHKPRFDSQLPAYGVDVEVLFTTAAENLLHLLEKELLLFTYHVTPSREVPTGKALNLPLGNQHLHNHPEEACRDPGNLVPQQVLFYAVANPFMDLVLGDSLQDGLSETVKTFAADKEGRVEGDDQKLPLSLLLHQLFPVLALREVPSHLFVSHPHPAAKA